MKKVVQAPERDLDRLDQWYTVQQDQALGFALGSNNSLQWGEEWLEKCLGGKDLGLLVNSG